MVIDLFSSQVCQDPYPAYEKLRRNGSVYYDSKRNCWLVGRYTDIVRALTDQETFSNRGAPIEGTLLGADLAPHARVRKIVMRAFTSARINALEGMIRSLTQNLVQRMAAREKWELINDLADPLPIAVVTWMLGIDDARLDDVRRWGRSISREGTGSSKRERQTIADEIWECRTFLRDHFGRMAREPSSACVADLLVGSSDSDRLTLDEMVDIGSLLITAGTETTTRLIGNAVLHLTRDPTWQGRLRTNSELISPFVEEMLRYDSPVQRRWRLTTRVTEIGGVQIPAGARVELLIGSANRDPDKFSDADQFRIDRHPNRHIAFGAGPHFCLGAQLARLETSIALEALTQQLPGVARARPQETVDYGDSYWVRGPRRLDLLFATSDMDARPRANQ